jgi:cell division protein FtsB
MPSYGTFGEPRGRRRRRAFWQLFRFLFALLAVLGVGGYGYQVGVSANQARTDQLEAELTRYQGANLDLRDQIALTRQQSAQADMALDSMRQQFAAAIPSGVVADLLTQVRDQLTAGVEPERLAFLIEAAALAETCKDAPVTKRFMPRTPISTGPRSYVRFDDRITVTGEGESARNDAGLLEAWYDPAEPIRLEFRTMDGATTTVEGVVPLTHQMVVDGKEYRFTAVSATPRFVEMTAQVCALPRLPDETVSAEQAAGDDMTAPEPDAPETNPLLD